jgi:hypothetical protein
MVTPLPVVVRHPVALNKNDKKTNTKIWIIQKKRVILHRQKGNEP